MKLQEVPQSQHIVQMYETTLENYKSLHTAHFFFFFFSYMINLLNCHKLHYTKLKM